MRDPGYSLREFHDDMVACFPELRLYLAVSTEELKEPSLEEVSHSLFGRFSTRQTSTSGRSNIEEYQRTIGALFAVYWFVRLDIDGKVSLCFGVDSKWLEKYPHSDEQVIYGGENFNVCSSILFPTGTVCPVWESKWRWERLYH